MFLGMGNHGHSLHRLFNSVVIPDDNMRQAGSNPEGKAFRSLLMRMRDGNVTFHSIMLTWSNLVQQLVSTLIRV